MCPKYAGNIDSGRSDLRNVEQGSLPLAKDALVFMISGIKEKFKIPIGYFLASGLTADEKAALVSEALIRLSEIGIEVIAITFDGHASNVALLNVFGGKWNERPYILDPVDKNRKIYLILDPAHMLKLVRNCIGSRDLIDGDGGKICWKYFAELYDAQKELPWNLGNKLTKTHIIHWDLKKMSVRLAAETLSNSVADSMDFMRRECDRFKDAGPTAKFIRIFNDIFDVMNSTGSKCATGFKRAISKSTAPELFRRLEEAMKYIKGLKVAGENKCILLSKINTAFTGFYNNCISFMAIFNDYVQTDKIVEIYTHRFSQDLLESFFGTVRSMGGKYSCFC